jgi:polyhydroxyalkanoate synthase
MAEAEERDSAQSATRPKPRLGPRPLPLHLSMAALTWQSSKAALPLLKNGSLPWKGELGAAAADLRAALAEVDPEAFGRAVEAAADARFGAFVSGIQAYRAHACRRSLEDPPGVWCEGAACLRDYGVLLKGGATRRRAVPLLVVPSLVNRAYILDLSERRSLLRWLVAQGFRPFLLDWGRPGEVERGYTLSDYVAGVLERALDAVLAETGQRPRLVGYCMGGLLALALALRRPADLSGLALLATPWDFHAEQAAQARLLGSATAGLAPLIALQGELPVELIQGLFACLDPFLMVRKFEAFSRLDPGSERAANFVAVEDWLNDGVPLAGPAAVECLEGWYGRNTPGAGDWRIAGQAVCPQALELPALSVIPGADRIVPPASAEALASAIPGVRVLRPAAGHIRMVVSAEAPRRVWGPVAHWLKDPGGGS